MMFFDATPLAASHHVLPFLLVVQDFP